MQPTQVGRPAAFTNRFHYATARLVHFYEKSIGGKADSPIEKGNGHLSRTQRQPTGKAETDGTRTGFKQRKIQYRLYPLAKQIEEIEASRLTKENQLGTARDEALKELQAQVKKWKENYLFLAPIGGTTAYLEYLENNQFKELGKNLFSIVPTGGKIVAKAELPLAGSGKVKNGQFVSIKLDNYPFEQFGMLNGQVHNISLLPNNDKYLLAIALTHGMTSTHQKELPFR